MKIGIVGYGGMGRMIEQDAIARGIEIGCIIDPIAKEATHKEISTESVKGIDVLIDFTLPKVIMENIKKYCELKANVIIGTTGWYNNIDEVKKMAIDANIKFMWASNFSIGVNIYASIIDMATRLINHANDYDIWAYEIHHNNKADSPSGTAKTLSQTIINNIDRKNKIVYEMLDRKIAKDEIHFASVRGGPVNFEHTIGFDSAADCISIKHAARNRSGYAAGAVLASIWLDKKQPGYYELEDFMKEIIPLKIDYKEEKKNV